MRLRYLVFLSMTLPLALVLAGCGSGSTAMVDVLRAGYGPSEEVVPTLDPRYVYLRVGTASNYAAYLVLGYVESRPEGERQVWYSATGEVIQLQNGRLVASAGLQQDWRAVRLPPLPAWDAVPEQGLVFQREVDLMPAYRFGRIHHLRLRPIAAPPDVKLFGTPPAALRWYEESSLDEGDDALPPARYAVDAGAVPYKVVYTAQCLSQDLCLTFQPLPPRGAPATPAAVPEGAQ